MSSQFEFILAREAQLMYRRAREFEPVAGNLTKWRGSIPGRGPYENIQFEVEILIPSDFPRQAPKVIMVTPTDHPQVDPRSGELNLRIITYWRSEYHLYQVINSIKGIFARISPKLPDTFASTLTSPQEEVPNQLEQAPPTPFQTQLPVIPQAPSPAPPIKSEQPSAETSTPFSSEIPEETPKVKELKTQIDMLEDELQSLQKSLVNKTEEVARLEGRMDVHNVPRLGDRIAEILLPQNPRDKQILDLQSEKIAVEDLIRTLEDKFECGEINSTEYAQLYKNYQKELHLINQKLKEMGITQ
ncbi:MAG TPA: ubiquitin-conjugating enzyme E2 [Candidatus Deferrimicrobium sp.]|nr:ubiquitin-conjugating enzyme E2 [Candidatus Deferrimicrobium sp.]